MQGRLQEAHLIPVGGPHSQVRSAPSQEQMWRRRTSTQSSWTRFVPATHQKVIFLITLSGQQMQQRGRFTIGSKRDQQYPSRSNYAKSWRRTRTPRGTTTIRPCDNRLSNNPWSGSRSKSPRTACWRGIRPNTTERKHPHTWSQDSLAEASSRPGCTGRLTGTGVYHLLQDHQEKQRLVRLGSREERRHHRSVARINKNHQDPKPVPAPARHQDSGHQQESLPRHLKVPRASGV